MNGNNTNSRSGTAVYLTEQQWKAIVISSSRT